MTETLQKAPHERTREDFLALTEGDILDLRGKELVAACVALCMDSVRWSDGSQWWLDKEGKWFEPASELDSAALAYESMAKRGWNKLTIEKNCLWFACMVDQSRDLGAVTPLMDTEAEARTMACVLAAWKDGQDAQAKH